jgi:hypothetical protein
MERMQLRGGAGDPLFFRNTKYSVPNNYKVNFNFFCDYDIDPTNASLTVEPSNPEYLQHILLNLIKP